MNLSARDKWFIRGKDSKTIKKNSVCRLIQFILVTLCQIFKIQL